MAHPAWSLLRNESRLYQVFEGRHGDALNVMLHVNFPLEEGSHCTRNHKCTAQANH